MMDAPVDAVDDEAEPLAELIGQPLVDDAADDRRHRLLPVEGIALERALLTSLRERPIDRLDDVAALSELPQRRLQAIR